MSEKNEFRYWLAQITDIPSLDPDDARKRKLLVIILFGLGITSILTLLITVFLIASDQLSESNIEGAYFLLISGGILLLITLFIYALNRSNRIPGWEASSIFLVFLTLSFSFSDTPEQLASGRSLFVYTIPIIISSVLLPAWSSFIFALLSSIIISYISIIQLNSIPNTPAIVGFIMIALISWLSSRNLEQALRELRDINANLDQLVEKRTHELTQSLSRELVLAGRNQAILESIADGVIVFDVQGSAIQANPALSNLIEMPFNNIISANVNDLVKASPMDAKNKGTLAGLLTKPGKEYTSQRVEWGTKTISVSSGQVFDREGGEIGTVAVFHDFTKEAELEKMKSAFVAMVSHELRTPLSAILGYAEMFKEGIYGIVNEKQKNIAGRVMSNTQRLLGLINDLLDQAQMEAGKLKIKQEEVRPAELLTNLHSVMDKIATDKKLEFTTELEESFPQTLIGDSARLHQIMVNLATNAVKFTETGTITVRLSKVNKKQWQIKVTDTGSGIPENELPHIFETFRQVEGATTRVHGGFGLGLSIVKQLTNLMSGEISVDSIVGKGSTFTVTLPLTLSKNDEESK